MIVYCFFSACGFLGLLLCFYAAAFVCSVLRLIVLFLFMWTNFSLLLAEFRPCEGDQMDQIEVKAFNCPLESRSLRKAGELFLLGADLWVLRT